MDGVEISGTCAQHSEGCGGNTGRPTEALKPSDFQNEPKCALHSLYFLELILTRYLSTTWDIWQSRELLEGHSTRDLAGDEGKAESIVQRLGSQSEQTSEHSAGDRPRAQGGWTPKLPGWCGLQHAQVLTGA